MSNEAVRLLARDQIFNEINEERLAQDKQWGGPEHDDQHIMGDWLRFIRYQIASCNGKVYDQNILSQTKKFWRQKLIKIAALAVAAIESCDRKEEYATRTSTTSVLSR